MRKLIPLLLILLIGMIVLRNIYVSPCDFPVKYRIDQVDSQFKLSREDFIDEAKKASGVWNKAYGKEIFFFDPKGSLSVNLVYDERQLMDSEIRSLENRVGSRKSALESEIAKFNSEVEAFEKRLSEYNKEVEYWNSQGGATEEAFNNLVAEQKELQKEADRLEAEAKRLNIETRDFNSEVGKLNQKVDTFNKALTVRPEEGLYIGAENRIEIYFYNTEEELEHTLSHEFGHALGMMHVENAKSIMYPETGEETTLTSEDLKELQLVCAKENYVTVGINRLRLFQRDINLRLSSLIPIQ